MTDRRYFLYPVPDGSQTMIAVENSLQTHVLLWRRVGASVIAVGNTTTAIYLRAVFEYRPADIHGDSLLEPHEVWIEDEDRPECERLLRENCPSSAAWFDLIEVSFGTDDEHREFAVAYTQITGLPNAFAPAPLPLAPMAPLATAPVVPTPSYGPSPEVGEARSQRASLGEGANALGDWVLRSRIEGETQFSKLTG